MIGPDDGNETNDNCNIFSIDTEVARLGRYLAHKVIVIHGDRTKMSSLRVWSEFERTRSDGTVLKLRIQDMPSEIFEDVMDFNLDYFVKDETFHKAADVDKNVEAMKECRSIVSEMMSDASIHIVVCCSCNDSDSIDQILGVSTVALTKKDDDDDLDDLKLKTNEMRRFFDLFGGLFSLYNVMNNYHVDQYHDGRGIAVHPEYRGLGMATEFLKVRRLMCKEQNVPMTVAWMTALGSQKAAERDGWETVFEISYDELAQKHGATFVNAPPTCKLMIARV